MFGTYRGYLIHFVHSSEITMTDDNQATAPADDQPADADVDTTDGNRDDLTTDDGLAAAAETMPAVDEQREVDDATGSQTTGEPVTTPELDVDNDGKDPVSDLAQPGDTQEG